MTRLADLVYREYMTFFEKAERTRRWNLFNDVPWDKLEACPRDPDLALCAETFCGVEMYLPDYVSKGMEAVRESFGQSWFMSNWAYEESKHSIALREYLLRTGQRSEEEMNAYTDAIMARRWQKPFDTGRLMTIYGAIQEMTTFVIYNKQERMARERGDEILGEVYRLIARDEIAHTRFYEKVTALLLEDDPEGTKADLAWVFRHFTMPAYDLVPDYDDRIRVMRTAGIDRGVFVKEVWLTILKRLGLTRHDLPPSHLLRRNDTPSGPRITVAS